MHVVEVTGLFIGVQSMKVQGVVSLIDVRLKLDYLWFDERSVRIR
jgi:hypothetical protein